MDLLKILSFLSVIIIALQYNHCSFIRNNYDEKLKPFTIDWCKFGGLANLSSVEKENGEKDAYSSLASYCT